MAQTDYKFEGWLGHDKSAVEGNMKWGEFEPKPWEETDLDIKITHCSVCGSDLHTLRSGWGPTDYPCCVGHEIVGHVVRVGNQVKHFKPGDRVGVGAQSESCKNCAVCADSNENYCPQHVGTYNAKHLNGGKAMGGYATFKRCPAHFVVKIPDGLPSELAAPMLCGGVTVFTPLRHEGCGPGKTVGIIGMGGLGHMAVMWAKALGADRVVVISRSSSKKADAHEMGADDFIATAEDPEWTRKYASSLDLMVCTVGEASMPLTEYLSLLKFDGVFVQVGVPDEPLGFRPFELIFKRIRITGSLIGSPKDLRDMFDLAVKHNVRPWVETRPMSEANQTVMDMGRGMARYRYTLVHDS